MFEGLQKLIDLQAIDDQRAEVRGKQERVPERRGALEEARTAAGARVEQAEEALKAAEAEQRRAETELQDQEALVHRLEGQQSQVKTNEAYTALLHELDVAKEAISGAETQILECMESIESASAESDAAREARDKEVSRIEAEGKALDAEEAELGVRLGELDANRSTRVADVDSSLLAQYEKVARRLGSAVARVSHETCLGCRVKLPPQLQVELIRGESLISCQRCKRILIPEK